MKLLKCSAGASKDRVIDMEEMAEMLRRANAMSMKEEEEEELKGELPKKADCQKKEIMLKFLAYADSEILATYLPQREEDNEDEMARRAIFRNFRRNFNEPGLFHYWI